MFFNNYLNLPQIVAHRGSSGNAPENTLAAMRLAKEEGASWVEVDVQITKDQQLVVFHDFQLGRTVSGEGMIHDHSVFELTQMNAGSWFDEKFSDQTIPTIEELFKELSDCGLGVNLEVKCDREDLVEPTVVALMNFLEHTSFKVPLEISSFHPKVLEGFVAHGGIRGEEILRLGVLFDKLPDDWQEVISRLNAYALHIHYPLASEEVIVQAHSLGCQVLVYTVDEPSVALDLVKMGVDSICTNFPKFLIAGLKNNNDNDHKLI